MKRNYQTLLALALATSVAGSGCAKKKSSSSTDTTATTGATSAGGSTTSSSSGKVTSVDAAVVTAQSSALVIPATLNLFGKSGSALADYDTDGGHFNTDDSSLDALSSVATIMCFLSTLGYGDDRVINKGPYVATMDMALCDKDSGSGGSSSSGSGKEIKLVNVIVDSSRETNKPLKVKAWFDMAKGGYSSGSERIALALSVAEGPSDTNPIGIFRLVFLSSQVSADGTVKPAGKGTLESSRNDAGQVTLKFIDSGSYTDDSGNTGSQDEEVAVTLKIDPTTQQVTGGTANLISNEHKSGGGNSRDYFNRFKLDWNNNLFYSTGQSNNGFGSSSLAETSKNVCKDETSFNMNVWRYGVYDNATKNRVALKGGFPLMGTVNGKKVHAYASYYGLWAEGNTTLASGTTLTKDNFGDKSAPTVTYTTISAPGRLTKWTKSKLALKAIDGIELSVWDQSSGGQVRVVWSDSAGVFQKTGTMSKSGGGGPQEWTDVAATTYTFSANGFSSAWSQALGGRVDIAFNSSGAPNGVVIYNQSDVTATMGDKALYCFQQCLVANLTSTMISGNTMTTVPDNANGNQWMPFPITSPVAYSFKHSTMSLVDASGNAIGLKSGESFPSSMNGPGARINTLIDGDTLAAMQAAGANSWEAGQQDVTYSWDVGNPKQPWTMYQGLLDSTGAPVTFDPPLVMTYTHTAANELSGNTTLKAIGKTFHLQYDGQNLQIPGHQDKDSGFWVNDFAIKAGATSDDGKYVFKPIEGSKYMKAVDEAKCIAAGLDPTKAPPLPLTSDFDATKANNDPMPDITALTTLYVSSVYVGK